MTTKSYEYLKENLIILIKTLSEYKANMYSSIFLGIFWFTTIFLALLPISSIAKDMISWNLEMFVAYFLLCDLIAVSARFFSIRYIFRMLIKGDFNFYLTKPINPIFSIFLSRFSPATFAGVIMSLILNIIFFTTIATNINFSLLFFALFFAIFIFENITNIFFESTNFLLRNNLFLMPYQIFKFSILLVIPYEFFKNFYLNWVFAIFSFTYISQLLIPNLYQNQITNISFHIYSFIITSILMLLFSFIFWKIGLKNYEGYN